tara:strand:- start:4044 stop:4988 length:945 start_codon:yes stop_codon:yes gene_type:complete
MNELHVLIDWTNHFKELTLPEGLILKEKITMQPLNNKKEIMSKFYNTKVDDFRGKTNFTLYILNDTNPIYDYRKTSKGNRKVNINIFDFKKRLRKIVGGYKIHATDNIQETKDNLKVLNLYDKYYNQKRFDSLEHVFNELNNFPQLKWVVMRNFEGMPHNITIDNHLDVDLLVNDYYLVKRILDASSATKNRYEDGHWRILNHVIIDNKKVLFDFRSVGDNYYDINLQNDMLNTRILHPDGFYIPNVQMHLYSLIYHAIIHKKSISKTYIRVFIQYGLKKEDLNKKALKHKLDTFMIENSYKYVKPEKSVGFHK